MDDLKHWQAPQAPTIDLLSGKFVTLKRLSAIDHGDVLFSASTQADADERFAWLPETPPQEREEFESWLQKAEQSTDPLYYVVIDNRTNTIAGRQTFLSIVPSNGTIEIGHILWNADISKTPATTEAFYLFAKHIFEDLGYRRFEWKCNNKNEPSKSAAQRYGMTAEGVFRQHMIVKGENRDSAWFSMLDHEWPNLKVAFETWLDDGNFDDEGKQKTTLAHQRKLAGAV